MTDKNKSKSKIRISSKDSNISRRKREDEVKKYMAS